MQELQFFPELTFALVTGIVSAFIYSLIHGLYLYIKWSRTRRYFLQKITSSILHLKYEIATILDIDPIDSEDHPMTYPEFIHEIRNTEINPGQYEKINYAIKYVERKIEEERMEALAASAGFGPRDFHTTDKLLQNIGVFLSSYYWLRNETSEPTVSNKLTNKLIDILDAAEQTHFHDDALNKIDKWQKKRQLLRFSKIIPDFPHEQHFR